MKGSQICTVVLEQMISGDQDLILKYLVIFAMLKETYDLLGLVNNDANKKNGGEMGGKAFCWLPPPCPPIALPHKMHYYINNRLHQITKFPIHQLSSNIHEKDP